MTQRILRRPAVEKYTGLSRSTIYAMIAEGSFPKPIRLGKRAVGWPESVVADWLEDRCKSEAA
ncbi:AlpA family transcriptional regulator [Maritimibacter sp. UBA3975]|uniref:helix-turn-helix transcriptional regulator n=1 Tax=Maritimibacter sp. UBA3975 TaxID=1946833 RepID=UPI000C09F698|nr:AlpA family transcriptional regulator [Maritimibacter sp. UBA3975]MAM63855.1 DNA-binding protein [Maritimibacter sp.]